jgi:ABC-type transporter Mla MlaB component
MLSKLLDGNTRRHSQEWFIGFLPGNTMMNHVHTHRPAATPSIGIARIAGPIDFDHARETRRMLLASLAVRENLLVDMSGVTAIDSAGVASLIEIQMTARINGKAFALLVLFSVIGFPIDNNVRAVINFDLGLPFTIFYLDTPIGPLEIHG